MFTPWTKVWGVLPQACISGDIISQDNHHDSLVVMPSATNACWGLFPLIKSWYNPYFKVLDSLLKILTLSFIPVVASTVVASSVTASPVAES